MIIRYGWSEGGERVKVAYFGPSLERELKIEAWWVGQLRQRRAAPGGG